MFSDFEYLDVQLQKSEKAKIRHNCFLINCGKLTN